MASKCDPFDVTIKGKPKDVLGQVRKKISDAGGSFAGDEHAGTFSGKSVLGDIKGSYSVSGQTATITITSKPFLAPCGKIESTIRDYFS